MDSVGLLITGDEVLSAKTIDRNGPFFATHLKKIGLPVQSLLVCGDSRLRLLESLAFLAQTCDVILLTGGLGPTSDDLTAEVVADFLQLPLVFFPEAWEACVRFLHGIGRKEIAESNKKQAFLPQGCALIANNLGTATGFCTTGTTRQGKQVRVYSLPGVPYEMQPMFLQSVLPALTPEHNLRVQKSWHVFLMGESKMQSVIDEAEKKLLAFCPGASISYQAFSRSVMYTATLPAADLFAFENNRKYLEEDYSKAVSTAFGDFILYQGEEKFQEFLAQRLKKTLCTLAAVETTCAGFWGSELSAACLGEPTFCASLFLGVKEMQNTVLGVKPYGPQEAGDAVCKLALNAMRLLARDVVIAELQGEADKNHLCAIVLGQRFFNSREKIGEILSRFHWQQRVDAKQTDNLTLFFCTVSISAKHTPAVRQSWVCAYVLCSLVAFLAALPEL